MVGCQLVKLTKRPQYVTPEALGEGREIAPLHFCPHVTDWWKLANQLSETEHDLRCDQFGLRLDDSDLRRLRVANERDTRVRSPRPAEGNGEAV